MEYISLPSVVEIGNSFLTLNEKLKVIKANNVMKIGNYFLTNNKNLEFIYFPYLVKVGNYFIVENEILNTIYLPCLRGYGRRCLEKRRELLLEVFSSDKYEKEKDFFRKKVIN